MSTDPFDPLPAPGKPGAPADDLARTVISRPQPSNRRATDATPRAAAPVEVHNDRLAQFIPDVGESFDVSAYPNPLIRAAGPILMSVMQLKNSLTNPDPAAVRKRMSAEIRDFDSNAKRFGVSMQQVTPARYMLCTFVDEVVLGTPWGSQSGWARRSLLAEFFKETTGGQKSFVVIERALKEPGSYVNLLEFAHTLIALGFEGQYRIRGRDELLRLQERLYDAVRHQRPGVDRTLSPNWRGEEASRTDRFGRVVPFWMIALIGAVLLGLIYSAYALALNDVREPVYRLAQQIQSEGPDVIELAPPPQVEAFDLEARLAPHVGNGLEVDVRQGVATISIVGHTDQRLPLFRSGSANLHQRAMPMLDKIAEVLQILPSEVTISGHTDSQGRIISNQALSERRARSVLGELAFRGIDRNRFEVKGYGSSRPIIAEERNEDDRAANRRVDIRFRVPDTMAEVSSRDRRNTEEAPVPAPEGTR